MAMRQLNFHADRSARKNIFQKVPFAKLGTALLASLALFPVQSKAASFGDMKAVFIRPCAGQLFVNLAPGSSHKTTVAGGTVASVCTDLLKSGVTDVFLPFKVDDEKQMKSISGLYGQLLYNSVKYDMYENPVFAANFRAGFDPIKSFMKICERNYQKAGKTIRFHAWFPVFKDRFAAKIAGQEGYLGKKGTIDAFLTRCDPCPSTNPDHFSKLFAEPSNNAVVEYELSLLAEIVRAYPLLDGINLDYIRYAESDEDATSYPVLWVKKPEAIADFIIKVRQTCPKMTISADVWPSGIGRWSVGQQNVAATVDILMPMMYTKFGISNSLELRLWMFELKWFTTVLRVVPIVRGWAIRQDANGFLSDLTSDIKAARESGADGIAIFTYESMLKSATSTTMESIKGQIGY